MSEPQDQTEAACGGSALTAELGALADQFECHALSRSIDDVEAAGRAMRAAKAEVDRLRTLAKDAYDAWQNDRDMRVGKLLLAMTDTEFSHMYRPDLGSNVELSRRRLRRSARMQG